MSVYDESTLAPESGGRRGRVEMWPEGNYKGVYLGYEFGTANSGTPFIEYRFDIDGKRVITVTDYLTPNNKKYVEERMAVLGVSGTYPNLSFAPSGPVPLWMKHEEYKGKVRERWSISTAARKPPNPSAIADFFGVSVAAPAIAPPPRPTPTPPPRPTGPARPLSPADKAAEEDRVRLDAAKDLNSAWAVWVARGYNDDDGTARFRKEIDDRGGEKALTPEQWRAVAESCPPF